jgi:hypothetical protein
MDPTSKQKFGFLNINGQIYEGEIENGQVLHSFVLLTFVYLFLFEKSYSLCNTFSFYLIRYRDTELENALTNTEIVTKVNGGMMNDKDLVPKHFLQERSIRYLLTLFSFRTQFCFSNCFYSI